MVWVDVDSMEINKLGDGIRQFRFLRHLGFVDDRDKFDAIAAADLLIMPSYFESLSMVALEAWALGRPVLANGKCDVLKGQCIRSNAGLYYENYGEFLETLRALESRPQLASTLGRNGRRFYEDHYDWPVIERKYLDMLERLKTTPASVAGSMEPLPGWFANGLGIIENTAPRSSAIACAAILKSISRSALVSASACV